MGLLPGSSSGYNISSHRAYFGRVALDTPISLRTNLIVAAAYEKKTSSLSRAGDDWTSSGTSFALTLGLGLNL